MSEYNETNFENRQQITRSRAVSLATYIVKDIIGIDITDGHPTMNVYLYKSVEEEGTYNWNIWWNKDNSIEKYGTIINANSEDILKVYVDYFCDPCCTGQKGMNENTNGLLREFYPKEMDLSKGNDVKLQKSNTLK